MEELKRQTQSFKSSCDEMRANQLVKQKEYEEQYTSIMEEVEILEKYDLEAQWVDNGKKNKIITYVFKYICSDALELIKFKLEKSVRKQQIEFD